jgi:hypothetical protein
VEKTSSKKWATSAIFKKLAKVNNLPMGENSANLVCLLASQPSLPHNIGYIVPQSCPTTLDIPIVTQSCPTTLDIL